MMIPQDSDRTTPVHGRTASQKLGLPLLMTNEGKVLNLQDQGLHTFSCCFKSPSESFLKVKPKLMLQNNIRAKHIWDSCVDLSSNANIDHVLWPMNHWLEKNPLYPFSKHNYIDLIQKCH